MGCLKLQYCSVKQEYTPALHIVHGKRRENNPVQEKQTEGKVVVSFHSILAITDAAGSLVEQRQFGAWGTADYFSKGLQASAFNHENSLLSRGYTGHEHFFGVSLIHMNGRMYDQNVGRFLSPDNNIQEPFNTQSFNRYSYTVNNPLKYIDPSGESWDDNDLWPPDEDEYEDENKDKDIEWTWNEDEDVNIEWTWNGKEWIGEITEVEYIIYNSSQEESFEDSDDGFGGLDDSFRNFDDRFENSNGFGGYDGFDQGPVRKREKYIRLKNQDNRFGEPGLVPLSGEIFFFIVSEGAVAGISAAFKGVRWIGRGSKSFFKGTKYTNKVLGQIKRGDFHAFPESVKAFENAGKITTIKGGDGVTRQMLKISGSYRGKQGFFEFIKNSDGYINHRLFRPLK